MFACTCELLCYQRTAYYISSTFFLFFFANPVSAAPQLQLSVPSQAATDAPPKLGSAPAGLSRPLQIPLRALEHPEYQDTRAPELSELSEHLRSTEQLPEAGRALCIALNRLG